MPDKDLCSTCTYNISPDGLMNSVAMALASDSLRYAKVDFIHCQCGNDYRIVRLKLPEVERIIGFDTPDGYDCDVWEETPDK